MLHIYNFILITCLFIFAGSAISNASPILMSENFEDKNDLKVSDYDGNWKIEKLDNGNSVYCNKIKNRWTEFNFGKENWDNYSITYRIKFATGKVGKIDTHIRKNRNQKGEYRSHQNISGDNYLIYVKGADRIRDRIVNGSKVRIGDNWAIIKLIASENNIAYFVNGEIVANTTDDRLKKGAAMIAVSANSKACVDDIVVIKLDQDAYKQEVEAAITYQQHLKQKAIAQKKLDDEAKSLALKERLANEERIKQKSLDERKAKEEARKKALAKKKAEELAKQKALAIKKAEEEARKKELAKQKAEEEALKQKVLNEKIAKIKDEAQFIVETLKEYVTTDNNKLDILEVSELLETYENEKQKGWSDATIDKYEALYDYVQKDNGFVAYSSEKKSKQLAAYNEEIRQLREYLTTSQSNLKEFITKNLGSKNAKEALKLAKETKAILKDFDVSKAMSLKNNISTWKAMNGVKEDKKYSFKLLNKKSGVKNVKKSSIKASSSINTSKALNTSPIVNKGDDGKFEKEYKDAKRNKKNLNLQTFLRRTNCSNLAKYASNGYVLRITKCVALADVICQKFGKCKQWTSYEIKGYKTIHKHCKRSWYKSDKVSLDYETSYSLAKANLYISNRKLLNEYGHICASIFKNFVNDMKN